MPPAKRARRNSTPHLAEAVDRNIKALLEVRRQMDRRKTTQDRIADSITAFVGSMLFVYAHVAWFSLWIAANVGWLAFEPFDPYPFGLLTMIVSLEAIFLSTFVLISQNRLSSMGDRRADLDLQINLLSEYEITKILRMVDAIAVHLKIKKIDPELRELEEAIHPQSVLQAMEKREKGKEM